MKGVLTVLMAIIMTLMGFARQPDCDTKVIDGVRYEYRTGKILDFAGHGGPLQCLNIPINGAEWSQKVAVIYGATVPATKTNVIIPEQIDSFPVLSIDGFENCSQLRSVQLPGSLVDIGVYAFRHCANLRQVNFPEGLKDISVAAFEGCSSLQIADLPKGLKRLGMSAFKNCSSLKKIKVPVGAVSEKFVSGWLYRCPFWS